MDRKVDPSDAETALVNTTSDTGSQFVADEGRFVPGTLLGGRYRIIGLVGIGGMGEVYRATDLTLGQSVALKFLPAEAASNQRLLERFHSEVRVARQVSHPNVCRVYDIGQIEGMPFISMEYVDGEDLASLLRRIGRLPSDKAVETARKICAGLAAAHDKGVIHRDLKPHNIMMNKRGEVLIMDFGLSAIADQLSGSEVRNGTPAYMSPEQLKGAAVTARSDIYSLGLVLYELFTGKRPFTATSIPQLLEQQQALNLISMSSIAADIDPAVERVIRRCLDPEPTRRPSSALAVSAALPGGDPLAAALAAGETPSPEMVASAGATEGLERRYSIPCLLFVIVCLFGSGLIRDQTSPLVRTPLEYPPDVLAVKSRELAERLGYPKKPADSTIWLEHRNRLFFHLRTLPEPRNWTDWLTAEAPILSVYREGLSTLDAFPFGDVNRNNPPPLFPGMVQVVLDGRGLLREFSAAPYEPDEELSGAIAPETIFRAAGLDLKNFTEVSPVSVPQHAADRFQAWRGPHPVIPNTQLVVEVGSWKGRITHVQVAYPWMRAAGGSRREPTFVMKARGYFVLVAGLIGVAFVFLLARRNWKLGRTDRRGAFRLAAAKFALGLAIWIGNVHATPNDTLIFHFFNATAGALAISAMVWVLYVALEPSLRARWPHSIVTWNRVLAGRWTDAQVGAHVLIGAAVGCGLSVGASLIEATINDIDPIPAAAVFIILGTRQWLAGHAGTLSTSLDVALVAFFALFGLRLLIRRDLVAALTAAILFTFVQRQVAYSPNWQAMALLYVTMFSILIYVFLRLGFLATISSLFVIDTMNLITLGIDWKTWYAPAGLATILLLLAIVLLAFWRSLGSRELLSSAES